MSIFNYFFLWLIGIVAYILTIYSNNYISNIEKPILSTYIIIKSIIIGYFFTYFDASHKKSGNISKTFQHLSIWKSFSNYFSASINLETELDHNKQYIFCSFPHGQCSLNHFLTMTNCCEMLSKVYKGERRDLAASILFMLPGIRELCILLGCVDAGRKTAIYNIKKKISLLIFIGGEKEQLMTTPNNHKIYLLNRKGFVKLSLQYNIPLIPMYTFGENECYNVSNFLLSSRMWLQKKFKIGIGFFWGRYYTLIPLKVELNCEIGKPIEYIRKDPLIDVTDKEIDELHQIFCKEMLRNKLKYGLTKDSYLEILGD